MISHDASMRGVGTNRRNALAHARKIHRQIERLTAKGFASYTAIARELHRRGFRGRRGGQITRERIYEIRQRMVRFSAAECSIVARDFVI